MNTVKRYDGYLTFPKIASEQQEEIRRLMDAEGLDIDVFEDALEFTFEGRDLSDKIIEVFASVALILQSASGEIRCEIDDDECLDPTFEFYTIEDSQLWKQSGKIVRVEPKCRVG